MNISLSAYPSLSSLRGDSNTSYTSKFTGMFSNISITVIFIVFLFIIIGGYLYYYYVLKDSNAKYKPNNEGVNINENKYKNAELLFFFTNWCPHCKTAKPVWNSLKTEYENKTINGYTIIFTEIDCTEESAEVEAMMNKYSVEGYPTIKLLKDGQIIEYDAKPTKETLVQFLNTVI
jgi:thiol-disulfide isomerase/thioredoxin